MSAQRSFVKKTKAGRVMKVVREHYLRDDIYVGCELATEEYRGPDPSAWKLSAGASKFVVIDTNVALHQLDFLAHKSIADVVVLSVVLEECRNRSKSSYDRLRAMCQDPEKRFFVFANEHHRDTYIKAEPGESPNDRNDRAIRVAAKFYRRAIPSKRIVLLTNDRGNLLRAKEEGVDALSVRQFAKEHAGDAPELMDLVAGNDIDTEDASKDAATDDAPSAKRVKTAGPSSKTGGSGRGAIFTEHLSASQTAAGIKGGTLHQGSLRTGRFSPWEGYVGSDAVGGDIMIVGRTDMNRAMDGDVVAVELLPESEWRAPGTKLAKARGGAQRFREGEGGERDRDG
jgi:exosome complex exonuclease DIS3/RRP44